MAVMFLKNVNRLKPRVGIKGLSRAEAVAQAEANVLMLREAGIVRIDDMIQNIKSILGRFAEDPLRSSHEIYEESNRLWGVAGVFGFPALGQLAYGLCDLMDIVEASGGVNIEAIKVHVYSLDLLRRQNLLSDMQVAEALNHTSRLRTHLIAKAKATS